MLICLSAGCGSGSAGGAVTLRLNPVTNQNYVYESITTAKGRKDYNARQIWDCIFPAKTSNGFTYSKWPVSIRADGRDVPLPKTLGRLLRTASVDALGHEGERPVGRGVSRPLQAFEMEPFIAFPQGPVQVGATWKDSVPGAGYTTRYKLEGIEGQVATVQATAHAEITGRSGLLMDGTSVYQVSLKDGMVITAEQHVRTSGTSGTTKEERQTFKRSPKP